MVFGFNLSFGIFFGHDGRSQQERYDGDPNSAHLATSRTQVADTRKSSLKRSREQVARNQHERELRADRESLHQLEMATSGKCTRRLDRKSLVALEESTQQHEFRGQRVDTPPAAWNYPIIHKLKGIGSDAGGYALSTSSRPPPSTSSPSPAPKRPAEPRSGVAAKDDLRAELTAAGWSTDSIEDLVKSQGRKNASEVESVHEWFDRLKESDAGRELDGIEDDVSGSVGRTPSPSSGAGDGGQANVKSDWSGDKERRAYENGGKARLASGTKEEAVGRRGEGEDGMSSDDDWVSLDYLSDDS